jgi:hypothetical protein
MAKSGAKGFLLMLSMSSLVPQIGCGRTTAGQTVDAGLDGSSGPADAVALDADQGCGSFRSSNCPQGSWCTGASTCGGVWQCQRDFPSTCTAGIVRSVCGCDGVVVASDGCPLRYAYDLGSQFGTGSQWAGAPCDPRRSERPPFAMRYRVRARGLEAFEGRSISWRFLLPVAAAAELADLAGTHRATIQGGGFDWSVTPGGPAADSRGSPLHQGYSLHLFVDVDGDGSCSPAADTGGLPRRLTVDFVKLEFDYLIEPPLPAPGQAGPALCNSFAK